MVPFINSLNNKYITFNNEIYSGTRNVLETTAKIFPPNIQNKINGPFANQAMFMTHTLGMTLLAQMAISSPFPITSYSIALLLCLATAAPLSSYVKKHAQQIVELSKNRQIACLASLPIIFGAVKTVMIFAKVFLTQPNLESNSVNLWINYFTLCTVIITQTILFKKNNSNKKSSDLPLDKIKDEIKHLENIRDQLIAFVNDHPDLIQRFLKRINENPEKNPIGLNDTPSLEGLTEDCKLEIKKNVLTHNLKATCRYIECYQDIYDCFMKHLNESRRNKFKEELQKNLLQIKAV